MRRIAPFLIFAVCLPTNAGAAARIAAASEGSLGLGLILGEPTAVGARYWLSNELAVQVWLGGTYRNDGVQLSTSLAYGIKNIVPTDAKAVRFDLSFAAGALAGVWEGGYHCHRDPWYTCHRHSSFALGLRAPVTFSVVLTTIRLEVFIELAPAILFAPWVDFELEGGLGVRYYF